MSLPGKRLDFRHAPHRPLCVRTERGFETAARAKQWAAMSMVRMTRNRSRQQRVCGTGQCHGPGVPTWKHGPSGAPDMRTCPADKSCSIPGEQAALASEGEFAFEPPLGPMSVWSGMRRVSVVVVFFMAGSPSRRFVSNPRPPVVYPLAVRQLYLPCSGHAEKLRYPRAAPSTPRQPGQLLGVR